MNLSLSFCYSSFGQGFTLKPEQLFFPRVIFLESQLNAWDIQEDLSSLAGQNSNSPTLSNLQNLSVQLTYSQNCCLLYFTESHPVHVWQYLTEDSWRPLCRLMKVLFTVSSSLLLFNANTTCLDSPVLKPVSFTQKDYCFLFGSTSFCRGVGATPSRKLGWMWRSLCVFPLSLGPCAIVQRLKKLLYIFFSFIAV